LVKLHSFSLSLCSFSFSGSINLYGLRFLVLGLVCFFLFDGVLCLVSEKKMRKIGEGKESRGDCCKEPVFLISYVRTESWVVLKDANFSWKYVFLF
jgi:hypothetical protein